MSEMHSRRDIQRIRQCDHALCKSTIDTDSDRDILLSPGDSRGKPDKESCNAEQSCTDQAVTLLLAHNSWIPSYPWEDYV